MLRNLTTNTIVRHPEPVGALVAGEGSECLDSSVGRWPPSE